MSLNSREYLDKEVQTRIRVYPHILDSSQTGAHVICENKTQTHISVKPEEESKALYSMLEYTPYQYLQTGCLRAVNLPRKTRLQFSATSMISLDSCLFDDDGVNELCIELKERAKQSDRKLSIICTEKSTQTDETK